MCWQQPSPESPWQRFLSVCFLGTKLMWTSLSCLVSKKLNRSTLTKNSGVSHTFLFSCLWITIFNNILNSWFCWILVDVQVFPGGPVFQSEPCLPEKSYPSYWCRAILCGLVKRICSAEVWGSSSGSGEHFLESKWKHHYWFWRQHVSLSWAFGNISLSPETVWYLVFLAWEEFFTWHFCTISEHLAVTNIPHQAV